MYFRPEFMMLIKQWNIMSNRGNRAAEQGVRHDAFASELSSPFHHHRQTNACYISLPSLHAPPSTTRPLDHSTTHPHPPCRSAITSFSNVRVHSRRPCRCVIALTPPSFVACQLGHGKKQKCKQTCKRWVRRNSHLPCRRRQPSTTWWSSCCRTRSCHRPMRQRCTFASRHRRHSGSWAPSQLPSPAPSSGCAA